MFDEPRTWYHYFRCRYYVFAEKRKKERKKAIKKENRKGRKDRRKEGTVLKSCMGKFRDSFLGMTGFKVGWRFGVNSYITDFINYQCNYIQVF